MGCMCALLLGMWGLCVCHVLDACVHVCVCVCVCELIQYMCAVFVLSVRQHMCPLPASAACLHRILWLPLSRLLTTTNTR
jgi:hypothetical protein